jgi:hypothetical protein
VENSEAAKNEVVQLMNKLDFGVSTEDVDELIASHSEPTSSEELIDIQEANRAPRHHVKPQMMTIKVLPLRL